jgi:hypothetical protein
VAVLHVIFRPFSSILFGLAGPDQRVVPRGIGSCDGAEPDLHLRSQANFAVTEDYVWIYLPASKPKHGGLQKCVFLCPVPRLRGLAGRAALHLGYSFFLGAQAAVSATLRCGSNGRASRSTAIR